MDVVFASPYLLLRLVASLKPGLLLVSIIATFQSARADVIEMCCQSTKADCRWFRRMHKLDLHPIYL